MVEKKLQVKNLAVSFRTTDGKVQAVRGINFDLNAGETLAIVGESGSGKSVTSKAILGILAGNSIVENGEIIYDGKDLLKISESEFHTIRGDKIAMIFQDPMSSLNPIVKIGKQLTEAMILKGKVRQKESKKNLDYYLNLLEKQMKIAVAKNDTKKATEISEKCKNFHKFETKHLELEGSYNKAHEAAVEAVDELENLMFEIEKNAAKDAKFRVKRVATLAIESIEEYVVKEKAEELRTLANSVKTRVASIQKGGDYTVLLPELQKMCVILTEARDLVEPNFFALGYFKTFASEPLPQLPMEKLNDFLKKYLDDHFMLDFMANIKQALMYSANASYKEKAEAIEFLKKHRPVFEKDVLDKNECEQALKAFEKEVAESVDKMEIVKDSLAFTFATTLGSEIKKYFKAIETNKNEQIRYENQQKKYDAMVARGKEPDWQVAPAAIVDLDMLKDTLLGKIDRLIEHYETRIANRELRNYDNEAVAVVDYLKANASGVVNKMTRSRAKQRAIKLMEEVGIPEPRKRYNQYPFEFSGGMRQRIVIAIALAADPDILICDEPTTALDVTIQSQILELINRLKEQKHLSVIFITHDLGVVANMADRIGVMYAGKIVEYGTAEDIFYHSAHPYTWALLSSMPDLDNSDDKLDAIPGTPPNMIYPPVGDAFAARNKYAMKIDFERQPPMFKITDTHYAATWLLHPDAPKVEMPKVITDRIARMRERGGQDE